MKPIIKEAIEAVESINAEIYEQLSEESYMVLLGVTTSGDMAVVTWNEWNLWSTEEETRKYYEETDSYEDMEKCLRRQLKEVICIINKLKL